MGQLGANRGVSGGAACCFLTSPLRPHLSPALLPPLLRAAAAFSRAAGAEVPVSLNLSPPSSLLPCCVCCSKKPKVAAAPEAAPAPAPAAAAPVSDWDAVEATPAVNRWDATPGQAPSETPGRIWAGGAEATPAGRWDAADGAAQPKRNRWDATPTPGHGGGEAGPGETPSAAGKRSRWDATPAMAALGATPAYGAGALGATPAWGAGMATPAGGMGMETPTPGMLAAQQAALGAVPMTPEAYQQLKIEREMDERNRWG